MVHMRKFSPEDLLQVELRDVVEASTDRDMLRRAAKAHGAFPVAFTMLNADGSEVLGCFGIDDLWVGSGHLWSAFAPGALAEPGAYRRLRSVVDKIWNGAAFGYHRWQAVVGAKDPEGIRLLEHLGMRTETLMRRYGPNGEDFWLYARVRE